MPWLKPSPSPASNNMSWLCFPLPAHHHFLPSADVKIKQTQRQWPGQAVKTKCHRDGANAQGFGSSAGQVPPPPFLHVYLAKNQGCEHAGKTSGQRWHCPPALRKPRVAASWIRHYQDAFKQHGENTSFHFLLNCSTDILSGRRRWQQQTITSSKTGGEEQR